MASYVDILGPCISLAAKMRSLGRPDSVVAGQAVNEWLGDGNSSLAPLKVEIEKWNYVDDSTGAVYRLYQASQ